MKKNDVLWLKGVPVASDYAYLTIENVELVRNNQNYKLAKCENGTIYWFHFLFTKNIDSSKIKLDFRFLESNHVVAFLMGALTL